MLDGFLTVSLYWVRPNFDLNESHVFSYVVSLTLGAAFTGTVTDRAISLERTETTHDVLRFEEQK